MRDIVIFRVAGAIKRDGLVVIQEGTTNISQQQIVKNLKQENMASAEYYRLALQQQVLYCQNIQECLAAEQEIEDLKARIAARHKKHRRCDKEILKDFKCPFCEKIYASDIALKLHFKLKHHKAGEERAWGCSTEEEHAQIEPSPADTPADPSLVS